MKNKPILFITLLVLATLACSAVSNILATPTPLPTNTPVPTNTPIPTSTPPPSPTLAASLFEETEFSETGCFGGESEGENVNYIPKDGQFQLEIKTPSWIAWNYCNTYLTPNDFIYEGDVTTLGGPDENALGLIFNYSDTSKEFYGFVISANGRYAFIKDSVNYTETKYLADWQSSSAIQLGNATNHLKIEAHGASFKYYVNGTALGEISNSDLGHGRIGFVASTFGQGGVQTAFDNLKVTAP
ncbi:MAG: hypothetical protein IT311_06435 [Anaerolineales bacterium]|nr:hypothetical protein [Anaerolineales bacterium]MCZ2122235.1 hypothetical protein [Anaerolineales bacterium]